MKRLVPAVLVAICWVGPACSSDPGSGHAPGSGGAAQGSGGAGSGGSGSGGGSGGAVAGSGGAGPVGSGGADAGGSGGAASDGGGTDVPVIGGRATCEGVTTRFCDDFEKQTSGQAPTGPFRVGGPAGAIVVDESKPHSGTKSVHLKAARSGAGVELQFTQQFPFNDQHGRLMFFMNKVPTNGSHWDIVHSRNQTTDWEIGGQGGVFELVCDPPDNGLNSRTKFPEGKWFCLQWQFKYGGAGADNTFLAAMDGVPVDKGMFTGPNSIGERWVAGPWRNLNVGWVGYQASNVDIELWIDDLAFGEQPIPCPPP